MLVNTLQKIYSPKMRLLSIILLLVVVGCRPFSTPELRKKARLEKKFQRFLKNNPELARTDTIIVRDTVEIPEINADTAITLNSDVSGLDSLFIAYSGLFNSKLDSLGRMEFKTVVKNYITERPVLQGTMFWLIDSGRMEIRVYQDGNKLSLTYYSKERRIATETSIEVQKIIEAKLNMFERFIIKVEKWGSWIFWILIIVLSLGVARYILRKFFPIIP